MKKIEIIHGEDGFYEFINTVLATLESEFSEHKHYKTLIICPSNRWERKLQSDFLIKSQAAFRPSIFSYDSFLRELFNKLKLLKEPLFRKQEINPFLEEKIIESFLKSLSADFIYYKINDNNLRSFTQKIKTIIHQFLALSYSADSFKKKYEQSNSAKMKDLILIFTEYEKKSSFKILSDFYGRARHFKLS